MYSTKNKAKHNSIKKTSDRILKAKQFMKISQNVHKRVGTHPRLMHYRSLHTFSIHTKHDNEFPWVLRMLIAQTEVEDNRG